MAQVYDFTAGINLSKLYEPDRHDLGHFQSTYNTRPGYTIRFGLNNVDLLNNRTRVDVTIENYGGYLNVTDGGQGGTYGTEGDVRKTNIALGWSPINLAFGDSLRFTAGLSVSNLLYEKVSGEYHYQIRGIDNRVQDIDKDFELYNSIVLLGARAGLAKTYFVYENFGVNIQYTFDIGLTREFAYYPGVTRSIRHSFTIGFQKRNSL